MLSAGYIAVGQRWDTDARQISDMLMDSGLSRRALTATDHDVSIKKTGIYQLENVNVRGF